jgi:hypothetical protein
VDGRWGKTELSNFNRQFCINLPNKRQIKSE